MSVGRCQAEEPCEAESSAALRTGQNSRAQECESSKVRELLEAAGLVGGMENGGDDDQSQEQPDDWDAL